MSLKIIKEINLGQSLLSQIILNIIGLGLFVLFIPVFTKLGGWLLSLRMESVPEEVQFTITLQELLISLVGIVVILVIHELIHGLFFKLFAPDRPVKYAFHWYALSASSPGTKYSKGKFLWIGIAPFIMITCALCILFAFGIISIPNYLLLASLHAAGCLGDFYFCLILLMAPARILVEDTGTGMILYQKTSA